MGSYSARAPGRLLLFDVQSGRTRANPAKAEFGPSRTFQLGCVRSDARAAPRCPKPTVSRAACQAWRPYWDEFRGGASDPPAYRVRLAPGPGSGAWSHKGT